MTFLNYKNAQIAFVALLAFTVAAPSAGAATITASLKPGFQADLLNTLKLQAGAGNPTFTRATTAYVTDWEGLLKPVVSGEARFTGARRVQNFLAYTEDFSNGAWTAIAGTKTVNNVIAPDGTMTGNTFTGTGTDSYFYQDVSGGSTGETDTISVWLKVPSGTLNTYLNVANSSLPITITTTWQRFSYTAAWSTIRRLAVGEGSTIGVGVVVQMWHPQLENVTGQSNQNPSEYVSNGVLAAPYHGAGVDGVQYFNTLNGNTVTSNVVTAGTGARITSTTAAAGAAAGTVDATGPLGYLAEGARTNYSVFSTEDLTGWVAEANASVSATTVVTPAGTPNASLIVSAGGVTSRIYEQSANIPAGSTTYTFSYFVKKGTVDTVVANPDGGPIAFTFSTQTLSLSAGESNGFVQAYPNGWYRIGATFTSTGPTQTIYLYGGNGFAAVGSTYAWGVQLEIGAFASSYFHSGEGAAKSRNADILTYQKSGNLNVATGTASMDVIPEWGSSGPGSSTRYLATYGSPAALEFLGTGPSGGDVEMYNTTNAINSVGTTYAQGAVKRIGSKWGSGTRKAFAAGVAGSANAYTLTSDTPTTISIGAPTNSQDASYTNIRNVKIWQKILTDTQLVAVTSTNTATARAAVPQTTVKTPTATGLVGYWKFDEGTGAKAGDSSGLGNSGTLVGTPGWTMGKLGNALNLNGSGQYMTVPVSLSAGQAITISAWAYSTESTATYRNIVDSSSANPMIWWNTSGKVEFDNGSGTGITTSATYRNQWVHIVLSKPSGSSAATYYVNGVSIGSGPVYSVPTVTPTWFNRAGGQTWLGKVDDVRIYNRALSATEITALYKSTASVVSASTNTSSTNGLVGLWSFDGKDMNWATGTAYDRSGNGNNGSLVSMSTTTSPTIGKIGQALKFDGTNKYVYVPNSSSLNPAGSLTVSVWARIKILNAYQEIVSLGSCNGGFSNDTFFLCVHTGGNAVIFGSSYTGGGSFAFTTASVASTELGQWMHLTGVIDTTNHLMTLYKNGVQAQQVSYTGSILTGNNLVIGGGTGFNFTGSIDDVRIYNRTLSATEVKALYNQGRSGIVSAAPVAGAALSTAQLGGRTPMCRGGRILMMSRRQNIFANGEFFHVYNRGADKRTVFSDEDDIQRFFQSMTEFNAGDPIGSLYENSFRLLGGPTPKQAEKLVNIVAYCLNPNHFHLLLEQLVDGGISEFMKRLGGGYTGYFNNKYERSGVLFQGKFKAVHIDSNEYLLHVSAYVNLNDRVHQLGGPTPKLVQSLSSREEYMDRKIRGICEKEVVLGQFKNREEYKRFALHSLESILERKEELKSIGSLLME